MAAERSVVQWGRTTIPYVIRRSSRRGTVSIAIDPRKGVLLTAPTHVPVERLDGVVRAKATWIVQRLRRQSDMPPPLPAREFVTGAAFLYLGRQHRLRVERGDPRVALLAGRLVVAVGHERGGQGDDEKVRAALVDWYREHAREWLPEIAHAWAVKLGVHVASVAVRDQRKRWGSCRNGALRFNWRIIQAPRGCIDYVVVHELVHLLHPDHSAAFWATLGRVMPAYERRRDELRRVGPRLEW